MPYELIEDLPNTVRSHLAERAQEIYLAAFNSAWTNYAGLDVDQLEEIGHRVANVYKAGVEKVSDFIEEGKEAIEERKELIATAFEAGKKAYKEKKVEGLAVAAGEN